MIFQVHSENMRKCGYGGIGRRAGFRYQWASRAGSSPVIRIFYKAWEALVDSPLHGDFAKGLDQSLCTPWAFWGNMSLGVSDL